MKTSVLTTPWNYHQNWHDGFYDGHKIIWKDWTIPVTDYIKQRYLSPVWYLNQLVEHWELLGAIALFLSDGTAASTTELSQALNTEISVINQAVELFNTLQLSPGSITTEKFLEKNLDTEEASKETLTTEKFLEENLNTEITHACGCLYQYLENKKLKNGSIVSYPRVEGERDKHNYLHWRWGYNWKEKIDGQWKNRSLGVATKIVTAVANMIHNGNSVQNIREFITLSKNSKKTHK